MKRPKQKPLSWKDQEKLAEIERQKEERRRVFAATQNFPPDRYCDACRSRQLGAPICDPCQAKIKEYAGV